MLPGRVSWPAVPLLALLCATALCACGNPGPPSPPSLMLPRPVGDLRAERAAGTVTLHWTMPSRSTDRVDLKGDQRVEICRAAERGACEPAATLLLAPGAPATYTDALPAPFGAGPLRLLRYEIRVENRRGKAAGASNPALALGGAAPPALQSVGAEVTAKGILVRWGAPTSAEPPVSGEFLLVRLTREQVAPPRAAPGLAAQTLEAAEHWEPATGGAGRWVPTQTLDATAALGQSYRYRVQLIAEERLGGQKLAAAGPGVETPTVIAKDVFPPAVPSGLQAAANAGGRSIDLSWNPDSDPGLAGYFVYRRVAGGAGRPERVSGQTPVAAPGWSDLSAAPGVRYAYSVSAMDASGNESERSAEATEALPPSPDPRR